MHPTSTTIHPDVPRSTGSPPARVMINYATNQVHYHHMRVPAACGVDEVGGGFPYVIDS